MNEQTGLNLLGRFTIAQKLGFVALGGMAVIAVIIGYSALALDAHKQDGATIDLAGRQRMLAQSMTKDVLLTAMGKPANYEATLRRYEQVQKEMLAHPYMATKKNMDARVLALPQEFKLAADAYLTMPPSDPKRIQKLDEVVRLGQTLSDSANDIVEHIDAMSESRLGDVMRNSFLLGLLASLSAVAMTLIMARDIISPLKACVDRARDIADGNLKVQALPVRSVDELGQLADSFNRMVESLREIASRTRIVTENLNASAAEIFATTKEQAAATRQQAAAVQEITATVEEINQSGKQVAERAKQVSGSAQSMNNASNLGLQAVESIVKAMEGIRHQAGSVADNIVTLSERTQAIGEIIATVTDIAEQSNLVALNAAIEAADAREDGRRFAVVAGEIKNLADQAKDATRRVRNILEEIQRGINTSVLLTEEAMKRVEYGREKVTVAEDAIRKMAGNVAESANAFQQIGGATNQQQIGFEQVVQALQEIRQASQQTASSTGQLESAAGGFNTLSQQLKDVVEKYRV
jgi:methyl-accepting chemotaxis protein